MQERVNGGCTLPEGMKLLEELHGHSGGGGGRRGINSELWHACAGPLVSLPQPGTLVYYFPQGHTEQVTASTKRMANSHIPCYPGLLSQMMCQVHKVTLHADKDTDEIYAQITLQPVNSENDVFPVPDFGQSNSKQPKEFFCKTLTASDTSTHGGFSVPRRAAEKLFPPLDHSVQPPNQELVVRDLHDNTWTFRHIYRGQPKRHLLTSGWSVFVGSKRLKAGDSILFIRDEKSQLLLGVRRANRQQAILPSSVLSADSMHIGVLAAAAHASANRTPFTIYYNPRACSSEFVVPLANYHRAAYGTQISIGMRFGMMFEAEDSTKRRYMGTIMGISDIDPLRWPNSKWRNLQVEWDEHGCVERPSRVSLWEIETPENIFIFSSPASAFKRPCNSDLIDVERKNMMKRSFQRVPNPGDVIQALLKPQNLNPGFQVGCPPIYSPHVQNNGKTGPSVQPSTIVGCFNQGNQLLNDILLQTGKLKELAESQQQAAPPQCLMEENSTVSDSKVVSSFDSNVHESQEVVNVPMPELNRDDQSCFVESKSNSSGSNANDLNQGDSSNIATMKAPVDMDRNGEIIRTPATRLPSENLRCELGKNQNCDDIIDPALLLEGDFKIQEKRVDSDDKKPHVDALMPDITDPIFPFDENPRESQNKSWYLENLGWMLKPPPYPMFMKEPTQPEFSASFGKVDLPSLYGADNSRTTSTDISAIVNPEHFSSTCTSEISGDQYLLSFAHDPSSSEMPNYSSVSSFLEEQSSGFLMHCSSRIPSGMQSISSEQTTTTACYSTPYELKGLSGCDEVPIETLNYLDFQVSNENTFATLSMANRSEDSYDASWNSSLLTPSNALASNLGSCQHLQLHVTSDLRGFSPQGPMDNSGGGTSGSCIDAGENSQMNKCARNEISPLRTYTKVQKTGSVGRCIDVTRFSSYNGLVSAIASMFGLEDQLNDLRDSEWKLVYVDYENDMLLLGDDPWEEFVNCVRCIRILSPAEVQQMSHEGLQPMDDPSMTDAYRTEQKQPAQEGLALCEGGA